MNQKEAIVRDSQRRIVRLKLLCNFYKQADLISVFIKTELIHSIFKDNSGDDLDYNKLELFHIQFTDSLLELLTKIKKRKESQIVLNLKEIEVNKKFINRYAQLNGTEDDFEVERKFYSARVSSYLADLYDRLTAVETTSLEDTLSSFSTMYGTNYYHDITDTTLFEREEEPRVYTYENIQIDSRLIGRLNICGFKVRFICGYSTTNGYYELFRVFQNEDEFIYDVQNKRFYFLDNQKADLLDKSHNYLKNNIVQELTAKNESLVLANKHVREYLPKEVLDVIKMYRVTLDNMNFLSSTFSIDEETNVLKAMLKLNLDGTM
ncbi:hypothetical protein [Myroides odoratus]|uniref:Uncharacterized protein n=1 Tax=Myroides odoratus TaxID=256 RepID=A0A9Q6ZCI4_MYROD|nr:hypothetical protein [Myroides odoratus]EHQ42785.1 hypothetical protein Myrod_1953 [Myroides odoratus DSM 2801]EKB07362.1 hypothetical protein HMPREF9716_01812 [Myroides odoratus CIP 103059]QQU00141.1 hypothetical protein I6I88_18590 [Myroides odoratus]WQD57638.1 hypothetical protein U0010_00360 [Myroides odoratus]STZ30049.1 Uncharacterised protein [Myroides odoratus]